MGQALTLISAELLRDLLELPEDSKVVGDSTGNVRLVVQSDRIPDDAEAVLALWMKTPEGTKFLRFEKIDLPAIARTWPQPNQQGRQDNDIQPPASWQQRPLAP